MKKLLLLSILIIHSFSAISAENLSSSGPIVSNTSQEGVSSQKKIPVDQEEPFFPGTLLQYVAKVLEPGHFAIQPYLLCTRYYGSYDKSSNFQNNKNIHQYEPLLFLKLGLIKNIDMEVIANCAYTHSKYGNSFLYGDTLVLFGFQLTRAKHKTWQPDIKLLIGENFPTGKYQNLNTQNNGIDGSGLGSYETFFILSIGKIIFPYCLNQFNLNLNVYYILPSNTSIRGSSVYGGGIGTKGSVDPGQRFITNVGIEYSLTRQWNIGIDIRYEHHNSSIFYPSSSNNGPSAGLPSSELFTLAPCLEYNLLSKNFGINCGVWFSVAGRNASAFTSPILSFFYYY